VNHSLRPFSVLFVCTGNICRSPIAEQVMRTRFATTDVAFSSAGTHALVGETMPEPARRVAEALGATTGIPHSPRLVSEELIEQSDLVLALTRQHRAEIVRLVPQANRRTVTLREAARLLESLVAATRPESGYAVDAREEVSRALVALHDLPQADALRALVPILMAERGQSGTVTDPEDDDVLDPYRRSLNVYAASGEQIGDAIDRIAIALRTLRAPQNWGSPNEGLA
jgi:protein-tyrosine phosphatase